MYTTILKHSQGLTKFFVHHLFYGTGQVKLSLDKYFMAMYLSLGKYQLLLYPHPCLVPDRILESNMNVKYT